MTQISPRILMHKGEATEVK